MVLVAELDRGPAKNGLVVLDRLRAFDQRVHRQVGAGTAQALSRQLDNGVGVSAIQRTGLTVFGLVFLEPLLHRGGRALRVRVGYYCGGKAAFDRFLAEFDGGLVIRRTGHQDRNVPAAPAHLLHDAGRRGWHGAQHQQVAIAPLHTCHLGAEVGRAPLVPHLFDDGKFGRLEGQLHAVFDVGTVGVILVDEAEALFAFLLGKLLDRGRDDAAIGGEKREAYFLQRRGEHRAAGPGKQIRDAGLQQQRVGGFGRRIAGGHHHGEYAVLVDQLLGYQNRLLGVVTRVLKKNAQLAPVDAASGVDFFLCHTRRIDAGAAEFGDRTGQVDVAAQKDFVLGDAACLGRCRHAGQRRDGGN